MTPAFEFTDPFAFQCAKEPLNGFALRMIGEGRMELHPKSGKQTKTGKTAVQI